MDSPKNRWLLAILILAMSAFACAVYEDSSVKSPTSPPETEAVTDVQATSAVDEPVQTTSTARASATQEITPTFTPRVDQQASALPVSPERGALAPDFELQGLGGSRVFLRDFRGSFVVINFWATWCAPCLIELPYFQESHEMHSPDLVILAINDSEPESEVQSYVDEMGFTFRVLLDLGSKVQRLYRVRGFPTTFFLDPDGVIRNIHIGLLTPTQLNRYLVELGVED
jgi:thiol-disulfide isomerase/thioredoxin